MKKTVAVTLLVFFAACISAYASPPRENCGCGLGSIIFANNEGLLSHTAAATTNGIFGNQTFGITSGTLECEQPAQLYARKQLERFVADNMDNLAKDIAMGSGESLDTLAELMSVPSDSRSSFNAALQENFSLIFPSGQVTAPQVIETINSVI